MKTTRKLEFSKSNTNPDSILEQKRSGKAIWYSIDKSGRPCLLIRPSLHSTKHKTVPFAIQLFEQACDILYKKNISDVFVILDFEGFGVKNFDLPFVKSL